MLVLEEGQGEGNEDLSSGISTLSIFYLFNKVYCQSPRIQLRAQGLVGGEKTFVIGALGGTKKVLLWFRGGQFGETV